MRGCKEMSERVQNQSQAVLSHFKPRFSQGRHMAPGSTVIRGALIRVSPDGFDAALRRWNEDRGGRDSALAIGGKTMHGAVDADGAQTHDMGVAGRGTGNSCAEKKPE